ncbi:hypothetical protein ACPDHD_11840 [Myroides odoratimimus]|uniref:hypothetical protein n=1 Tax=Myroides odoratimimus TaxID=76832 RepID=UPI003D2EED35
MLEPLRDKNSIDRVTTNFFIAQRFPKPDHLLDKLANSEYFRKYTKKTIKKSDNIDVRDNSVNINTDVVDGFYMEEFDSFGRLDNLFLLQVEPNRTRITIENRHYSGWTDYIDMVYSDLFHFQKETKIDLYLQGIQLSYIDEFNWTNEKTNIECKDVFRKDSDLLSKSFLKAHNGASISMSQHKKEDFINEQKVEIVLNNDVRKIVINFIEAFQFNDLKIIENSEQMRTPFKELLDKAHDNNKLILKEILTDSNLQKINLI